MDWWQDKPSSGGFELCKLSRSVWDKVRGYIVKIQEKRKQTKPLSSMDADDAPRTPDTATSIHSGRADGNSGTKKDVDDGKDSNQLKVSATATYSGRADGTGGTQRGVGDTKDLKVSALTKGKGDWLDTGKGQGYGKDFGKGKNNWTDMKGDYDSGLRHISGDGSAWKPLSRFGYGLGVEWASTAQG